MGRSGLPIVLTTGGPDPKPKPRIRDPQLLKFLHVIWKECALCRATDVLSVHHINKHPRDDVEGNCVMLCGSGTTGCHGLIEAHDHPTIIKLGTHILESRNDTIAHLFERKGPAAKEWIRINLLVDYDAQ